MDFVKEQEENRMKELSLAEIYFANALTQSKKLAQETMRKDLTNQPDMFDGQKTDI